MELRQTIELPLGNRHNFAPSDKAISFSKCPRLILNARIGNKGGSEKAPKEMGWRPKETAMAEATPFAVQNVDLQKQNNVCNTRGAGKTMKDLETQGLLKTDRKEKE